jgi:hypothetical protein
MNRNAQLSFMVFFFANLLNVVFWETAGFSRLLPHSVCWQYVLLVKIYEENLALQICSQKRKEYFKSFFR